MSFANKRPGSRILPARRLTPQVDPNAQFEKLASAIDEIYKHNASQLSFEELYRTAYGLVLSKNGQLLYDGVKGVLESHLCECVHRDILQNADLASKEPVLRNNETFLASLRALWSEHVTAMLMIKDVLMYVDKVFVKNAQLPSIYDMGMGVFRDQVLFASGRRLGTAASKAVLSQINSERRGEEVNRATLRGVVDMMVELQDSNQMRTVYEMTFEPQLLAEAEAYYRNLASARISELGAPEYASAAQSDMDAEMDRVKAYLAPSTADSLKKVLLNELIASHANEVLEIEGAGLVQMLGQRNIPALQTLYSLYSLVPTAIKELQAGVHHRIVHLGARITASLAQATSDESPASKGPQGTKSASDLSGLAARTAMALRWIQDMLALYDVYDEFFDQSFAGSLAMRNTINDAFIDAINANPRAPELLSLFIDDSLKKGLKGKSEQEVDHILERSVLMFRFLKNKDTFEHYYKVHLAKRLLFGRSVSDDAEQSLVSKFKVECGSQFTLKLEGMFKDIHLSSDMAQELKDSGIAGSAGFDMGVSVLTPTFWPVLAPSSSGKNDNADVVISDNQIATAIESFSDFYLKHHSGRRLMWQYNMGSADLKVRFGSRTYELNVSTYQMLILMLFADSEEGLALTTTQIQEKTQIPDEALRRQLQSLACAKYRILAKAPKSRDVEPTDKFSLNEGFRSPQYRIRVPVITSRTHVETEKEKAASQAIINQERQYLIEAAIVRIMKDRRQMVHDSLVNETIVQLSSRFLPSSKAIKEGIGKLIDREYLQRSPDDPRLYIYLA